MRVFLLESATRAQIKAGVIDISQAKIVSCEGTTASLKGGAGIAPPRPNTTILSGARGSDYSVAQAGRNDWRWPA